MQKRTASDRTSRHSEGAPITGHAERVEAGIEGPPVAQPVATSDATSRQARRAILGVWRRIDIRAPCPGSARPRNRGYVPCIGRLSRRLKRCVSRSTRRGAPTQPVDVGLRDKRLSPHDDSRRRPVAPPRALRSRLRRSCLRMCCTLRGNPVSGGWPPDPRGFRGSGVVGTRSHGAGRLRRHADGSGTKPQAGAWSARSRSWHLGGVSPRSVRAATRGRHLADRQSRVRGRHAVERAHLPQRRLRALRGDSGRVGLSGADAWSPRLTPPLEPKLRVPRDARGSLARLGQHGQIDLFQIREQGCQPQG